MIESCITSHQISIISHELSNVAHELSITSHELSITSTLSHIPSHQLSTSALYHFTSTLYHRRCHSQVHQASMHSLELRIIELISIRVSLLHQKSPIVTITHQSTNHLSSWIQQHSKQARTDRIVDRHTAGITYILSSPTLPPYDGLQ